MKELVDWLHRASEKFPATEMAALFFPPGLLARHLASRAKGPMAADDGTDLSARDPELVRVVVDMFRAMGKHYFRWTVEGIEHLPAQGPALLVGNHNGGTVITDSFLTFVAVWDRFGPARALYGLAHDVVYRDGILRRYALRFGALRAGHDAARKALQGGHLLLVYPGSDVDAFRPFRDRHRIVLGGRKGFVRLALRQQVPIVPVVSVGTHEQFVVLSAGKGLAKALGLKRLLRSDVLPVVVSVPWGLSLGFLPYIPLPAQTTVAFGPPLHWPHLGPEAAEDDDIVDQVYRDVEAAMQKLLDGTAEGRRPFLGKRDNHEASSKAVAGPTWSQGQEPVAPPKDPQDGRVQDVSAQPKERSGRRSEKTRSAP